MNTGKGKYILSAAIITILLISDQVTKWLALKHLAEGPKTVLPFLDFVLVWNRGISFGMFNQGHDYMPWVLSALSLIIVVGVTSWLIRTNHLPTIIALAAVISGAIGNIIDRIRFGAVVDFIDVHVKDWHYPAFNIADSAIVLGIAFIVLDGLFWEPKRRTVTNGTHIDIQS